MKHLRQQEAIGTLLAIHQVRLESGTFGGCERVFDISLGDLLLVNVAMVHRLGRFSARDAWRPDYPTGRVDVLDC